MENFQLKIITNLPSLIVTIWDGFLKEVGEKMGSSAPIALFKNKEEITEIIFDNLPKGLYEVRMSLPYYSDGTLFKMPIVMDKHICLDKNIEFTFKANLNEH